MGRKLTMVATLVVMPGGFVVMLSIVLLVLFARTARGQRALVGIKRRVPPRLRARVKQALVLVRGENLFLPPPPPLTSR